MAALYLASRSPRRRELLTGLGYRFEPLDVEVDEARRAGESPARFVQRMAREKSRAGLAGVAGYPGGEVRAIVIAADTIVVVDDEVLGKPRDGTDALMQLGRLSGRDHLVLTAVAVVRPGRSPEVRLSRSRVWFRGLAGEECARYVATGEPLDKAGSYAIQGLAAAFVTRLEGSWSGVVGLPLHETAELLERAGVRLSVLSTRPAD